MSARRRRRAGATTTGAMALLACAGAWVAAPSAQARGHAPARPDLVVGGATALRATSATTVKGTIVVRNSGRRRAGATSVAILMRGASSRRERSAGRVRVARLAAGAQRTVSVTLKVPAGVTLPATVRVCADAGDAVTERREANNCRDLGRLKAPAPKPKVTPPAGPAPAPVPAPVPAPAPAGPVSSVPTAPVPYTPNAPFALDGSWVVVPSSYDASHRTPTELLVWMHGCGGEAEGDASTVAPQPDGAYIAVSVGGRDGGCWDVNADPDRVRATIAQIKTRFNIDPKRVVLGGYSSGGDLAYRLAFYHASEFAGVLAENTSPFKDTGSPAGASIAAASYRFPVVHLAHTEDDTYPIAGVRSEIAQMQSAGFPATLIERPGAHYDANTDSDLQSLLLPHLADGWRAP